MSSVSSSAASRMAVTGASSVLSVGRNADGAAFAVKAAIAAQDPESDTPSPTDEVDLTAEAEAAAAHAASNAASDVASDVAASSVAAMTTAQADTVASANLDTANQTLPPAAYNGTTPSLAAYAYAQTMQALLAAKTARLSAARRVPKPDPQTDG